MTSNYEGKEILIVYCRSNILVFYGSIFRFSGNKKRALLLDAIIIVESMFISCAFKVSSARINQRTIGMID